MAGELDLVETDELFDALRRRFDTLIFMGVVRQDHHRYATRRFWHGNHLTCLGMLSTMRRKVLTDFDEFPDLPQGEPMT